ncbi:MAG: hypothetical protein ABMB14_41305, partial [Myxococcota bacterium]
TEGAMNVELTLATAAVPRAADLAIQVAVTNPGPAPVTVNTLFLGIPSIVLQVRRADGSPVPKGPPPVPPIDDGASGRRVLAAGQTMTLSFTGAALFGTDPGPGRYEVAFRFDARPKPGTADWGGHLESAWVPFAVGP